jgi:predicted Zn-dependent protease
LLFAGQHVPPRREKKMAASSMIATLLLASSLALLGACASTTSGGAVGAERKQLMLVSQDQMNQIAAQSYAKLKADAAAAGSLNKDPALLQRVQAIAARLIPQTGVFRGDAPGWAWEVNVIANEQVNAFCMPGGKIVVFSGLAQQLGVSDDELAVVVGHEISHALREHSREQVSQAVAAKTAIDLGSAIFGLGQASSEIANIGYEALIAPRFSRKDENEADRMGLELTARAGYDPRAGVTLWQKMMKAKQDPRPPSFLSSHPTDESRIEEMKALQATVMPLYEAARRR